MMEENNNQNVEWPLWKCSALTFILCGIPLLFFAGLTTVSVIVWGALVLVYVGLVRLFGSGFVVHGAILVIILAILTGLVLTSL